MNISYIAINTAILIDMKKFFILLLTGSFICVPGFLFSQSTLIGFNGGISIPSLKSNGDNEISKDYSSRLAGTFGVFGDLGISRVFSLKAAIQYAGQGGKRNGMQPVTNVPPELSQMLPSGTMLYANFNNESVLKYLEIPVMAKLTWGNKLKYYVNAGPYTGILIGANQKTDGSSQFFMDKGAMQPVAVQGQPLPPQSFNADTKIKKDIHSVNVGLTGGLGLGYQMGNRSEIAIDARAAYGLVAIQKDSDTNGKSRTGGLFLTLGYAYSLHR